MSALQGGAFFGLDRGPELQNVPCWLFPARKGTSIVPSVHSWQARGRHIVDGVPKM
jgi:hypothetical protein